MNTTRKGVLLAVALFVSAGIGYLLLGWGIYYWKEYVHQYESGAVSDLLALHTIQENYRKDHGSYAATFAQLGLPLGARLNSDVLTWSGPYNYRIAGIERNQEGLILDYSIDARPIMYSHSTKRSYLMDDSGTIHFTSENRAATDQDRAMPR